MDATMMTFDLNRDDSRLYFDSMQYATPRLNCNRGICLIMFLLFLGGFQNGNSSFF